MEVERRLVRHYLYTDGAAGSGPLTYVDASPGALREALGEAALETLARACGPAETVARVLAAGWNVRSPDPSVPGYFRYLVLTCAVVATADDNPDTQDFGRNLRRIVGGAHDFTVRAALPGLWQSLRNWCARARKRGDPVREMVLPRPGVGAHIGLTNAIAFPGWRDLRALRRWFDAHPSAANELRKPADVANRLCPEIRPGGRFNEQLVKAADEYMSLYRRGTSLLHLHRLWEATCRALDRRVHKDRDASRSLRLELEVGHHAPDTRIRIAHLDRVGAEDTTKPSAIYRVDEVRAALAAERNDRAASLLCARFDAGAVPFVQQRFGLWSAEFAPPAPGREWLYLVTTRIAMRGPVATLRARGARVSEYWSLIGPVGHADATLLHRALGLDLDFEQDAVDPLTVDGGVRTRFGLLGRVRVLPAIRREGRGELAMEPVEADGRQVLLQGTGDAATFVIASEGALDGTYRLSLTEEPSPGVRLGVERQLRFVENAPEHHELGRPGAGWDDQPEHASEARRSVVPVASYPDAVMVPDDGGPTALDDLLEVIYARGRTGWGESDLVPLVRALLPGPSPWDILRSLQESGWLRRTTSSRWHATQWWLIPPRLVALDARPGGDVLLEGSCPRIVRDRFEVTVAALGGRVHLHAGVGPLAVRTARASGVDGHVLASELGWPRCDPGHESALPAPQCWPPGGIDESQHRLHETWNWGSGVFDRPDARDETRIRLDRWTRDDRPDIFTIAYGSRRHFSTASRTVAVAESFRIAGVPMFSLDDDVMRRIPLQGHLPMHLAHACHRATLRASGPVLADGRWSYAYAASARACESVRRCLGRHFLVDPRPREHAPSDRTPIATLVGRARRRGLPFRFPIDDSHA